MDKNKITYGLKSVHYAVITSEDTTKVEYGTPVPMPGAESISFSKNIEKILVAADDDPAYVTLVDDKGYDGDLILHEIPEDFYKDCLGMKVDGYGIIENKDNSPKPFALLFEFAGDAVARRHVLYRCMAVKPDFGSQTKGSGTAVNKVTLQISATPAKDTGNIKYSTANNGISVYYQDWFKNVQLPVEGVAE